jgi:hypothetical protein
MRRQLATYVNEEEFQQLARQAAGRHVSLSRYVKERLLNTPEGSVGEASPEALAETLVTVLERRLPDGLERVLVRALKPLWQRLDTLTAMLDQFALTMLINTPEIGTDMKQQALAAGERRHRGWHKAVAELMREIHPEADANAKSNGARP